MALEVVAMFARWWDNFQESCDIRLAVGCGCAVAWVLLVAISPVLSTASTFIGAGLSWRSGIVVGGVLAFGLAAIACRRPGKLCDVERRSPSVPPLAMSAVLSPIGAILHQSIAGGIFAVVAGLCVGCGLAGLILGWAAPFSAVRLRKRVVATVAAMFAGGALYLIVVLLPAPLSFAVALALAPTSLFLAMTIDRFPAPGDEADSFPTIGGTTETGAENGGGKAEADTIAAAEAETRPCSSAGHPDLTRLFGPELSLAIVVYGALFVLAGHVLPEVELAWMASVLPGIANVGALLVSETVLTLYLVKRIRIESPRTAYRPATALVAVGFLLLPFVGDAGAIPCMAVAFAGFGCFLVYLWIVMGNMAQRWSAAPIPTCAFGFMLLFSGIVLGELAAWTLYRVPLSFGYPAAVSIVSLFMLVVLAWSMADGSRYAHETAAMGGVPFSAPVSSSAGTDSASEGRGADAAARLYAAAETYGLSPREVEVTALLLRGRSIPYICDELFIAKSTAQTHVRHIYAKMNITGGRQELIDRIEGSD